MSFLKWVGGKETLLNDILSKIPKREWNKYYELFLGGGSVLIRLLEEQEIKSEDEQIVINQFANQR
jgi:site-specific DNA-adenine methylase